MPIHLDGLMRLLYPDIDQAVDVLTRSFWNDPLNIYFFPDEDQRRSLLPLFFEYRLKQGIRYGEVFAPSSRIEGVAIWRYSNSINSSLWRDLRSGGLKLYRMYGGDLIGRMQEVDNFTSQRRQQYAITPYLHLGPLGVDPEYQGQGFAGRLIRPMLSECDARKMHCYLEAQSESNVALYEHFGFEVIAVGTVPNTDITHWDMIRRTTGS
jgi:GNAT superfamily N-acetyltransferase